MSSRKTSFVILLSSLLIFYGWIVYFSTHPHLPHQNSPFELYSNQTHHDIKLIFRRALQQAHKSIFLSVYGITDPEILALINKKAQEDLTISLEYDPTASSALKKILPPSIKINPIKSSGLMHRKIILIDQSQVFLGSANLTMTSLRHHANLVVGMYHPPLAAFLANPHATSYFFEIEGKKGEIYLFPDPQQSGLTRLIHQIENAKKNIKIAMFTFTHPKITEALCQAKKRGVEISIAIDSYTARGASKKSIASLGKEDIKIFLSQGKELLHHKWAIFDAQTLVIGSANWTKAAFNKNHDFLLFLYPLDKKQKSYIHQLWKVIEAESIPFVKK